MLLRVMFERYIRLFHKNDLKIKIIGTSCILCVHIHWDIFPFMMMSMDAYTDDNGGHASHDTQGSIDLRTSLRTTSSIMMNLGGYKPPGDPHLHM